MRTCKRVYKVAIVNGAEDLLPQYTHFVFFSSPLAVLSPWSSFTASAILGIMVPTRCCPAAYNEEEVRGNEMSECTGCHESSGFAISNEVNLQMRSGTGGGLGT